jgi:ketosteroid isomerase-like protein
MDTQAVLDNHLQAFGAGDLEAVLADYTDESVFISPRGTVHGVDGLRGVLEGLFSGLFAPGTYEFTMDAMTVEGEIAQIAWHATCATADIPFATDTFVVRDGKIVAHTFGAKIDPR